MATYPYYSPQVQYPYIGQQSQQMASPMAASQSPPMRIPYMEQSYIGIKGRPVSSLEEVKAMSIDFDGSVFFFPDLANQKIYTKQINLDGTSSINIYSLENNGTNQLPQYVTKEELELALSQLKQEMAPPQGSAAAPQSNNKPKLDF